LYHKKALSFHLSQGSDEENNHNEGAVGIAGEQKNEIKH
jgi:hypothetical protein